MITPQNVLRHELIGLQVTVADSSNPAQRGITGVVVDETRNMLSIRSRDGIRRIQKKSTVLHMRLPDDTLVRVDGSALVMQPERRISMRIR